MYTISLKFKPEPEQPEYLQEMSQMFTEFVEEFAVNY